MTYQKFSCAPNNFKLAYTGKILMVRVGSNNYYVRVTKTNFNKTLKNIPAKTGTVQGYTVTENPEYVFIDNISKH